MKEKKLMILYCISGAVAFFNVGFYANKSVSDFIVLVEVALLFYALLRKSLVDYIGLYMIFCGLSLEYSQFLTTDELYGFKNTRILGVNLGILMLLPPIFCFFRTKYKFKKNEFYSFTKIFFLVQISSFISSVLAIAINDNKVRDIPGFTSLYIGEIYQMSAQPTLLVICFMLLEQRGERIKEFRSYVEALIFGAILSLVISYTCGFYGIYGGVKILIASVAIRFIPIMLIFPIYREYRYHIRYYILGILGTLMVLLNNATGKTLIIIAVIPLVYIYILMKNRKWLRIIGICAIASIAVSIFINNISKNNILLYSKFAQVMQLRDFLIGKANLSGLNESPQNRVYEILNITQEYLHKPYFALFGKGFMGTFTNRVNMPYINNAYTDIQWSSGAFYVMHESFSRLYLSAGLIGIYFFVSTVITLFKITVKNPWALFGLFWFLIGYGYSVTMTAFGFSCLALALLEADEYHNELMLRL